ncbi:hypothetical protein [Hoylesella buccalis]|uniref:hypothetical protein n=1 Tax=Hoylesella buccalis TaxID=28127 RepID=UPI00288C0BC8|nr:hypothetical protein [Hoylesella buccalis]
MNNEMCGCGTEEKTNTAKGIVRINYKQDFELVVELLAGDKPYQLGDEDFRIDFIVMASRYTVGRTAGVCERCAVDGNKIRCFMDGHGLPPGELRAEVKVNTLDPNYADGKRLSVAIAEGTVVLVKDNTRFDGAVIKANIPVVLIDAYQLAKEHGYKGTIDEYYATFNDVSALLESMRGVAEEERKRSTSEEARNKAEQQRKTNEDARHKNENERVRAESNRASAEKEQAKAEQQRKEAEVARNKAETERASAEGKRITAEKERSTTFSSMQENINSKIKEANAATSDLKSIKDVAVSAANGATTATTQANEAARQARVAAENVKDGESGIPRQALHGTTDTTFSLRPNIMEVWGVVPELNLSLAPAIDAEFVTEYLFEFTCPTDKGTSLNLPAELKWYNEYVVVPEAGKTYQASIVNHVIVMGRA